MTPSDPYTRVGACNPCGAEITQVVSNECRWIVHAGQAVPDTGWLPQHCEKCRDIFIRNRFISNVDRSCREALTACGVPARFMSDLSSFEPQGESLRLRETVSALVAGSLGYRWLVICGTQGCGKTTEAANAIYDRISEARERVIAHADENSDYPFSIEGVRKFDRFTTLPSLVTRVTDTFKDSDKSKLDVLKEYFRCNLLVLDDIGTEKPTEHTVGILHEIVDKRYCDASLTIFTTNLPSLGALGDHLARLADDTMMSRRIIDRMIEMAKVVKLTIPSYRPARGKEPREWRSKEQPEREPEPRRPDGRWGVVL